jgi:hypothetical protein
MVRVEIHDNEYALLHGRMETASFNRTVVDSSTGKRVQLPNAEYTTDAYSTARVALLAAIGACLTVDPLAEIVVSGGDQVLTFGCREVHDDPWASILANLAQSTLPVPSVGLHDFYQNLAEQGPAGTVPVGNSSNSTFWEAMFRAK